jgi:hypothetical protein
MQARFGASLDLVPCIDVRGWMVPHLYYSEARTHTFHDKGCDTPHEPIAQLARDGVAVNGAGLHGKKSAWEAEGRRAF